MPCVQRKIELSIKNIDKSVKEKVESIIKQAAEGDIDKINTLVSIFGNDNTYSEFKEHLFNKLTDKQKSEFNIKSKNDFKLEYLLKGTTPNTFRAALNSFYNLKNRSVNNYNSARKDSIANEWENSSTRKLAITHTSDIIKEILFEDLSKTERNNESLIQFAIVKLLKEFVSDYLSVVTNAINNSSSSYIGAKSGSNEKVKKLAKELKEDINILNTYIEKEKENEDEYEQKFLHYIKNINTKVLTLGNELNEEWSQFKNFTTLFFEITSAYTYSKPTDYTTIRIDSNNSWFSEVLNDAKIDNIKKSLNNMGDDAEFNEPNETDTENSMSETHKDEGAKEWVDKTKKNFETLISGKIKLFLSTVPKLSQPITKKDTTVIYDTNNSLGVRENHSWKFLTNQIIGNDNITFDNIESLIEQLYSASTTNKELYSLSWIAQKIEQNRDIGNMIIAELSSPRISKNIIDISKDSIKNGISNMDLFKTTSILRTIQNDAISSAKGDIDSKLDKDLKTISSTISSKTKFDANDYNNYQKIIKAFFNKYFPSIDYNSIYSYINSTTNINEKIDRYKDLFNSINKTYESIVEFKNEFNKALDADISIQQALNSSIQEGNFEDAHELMQMIGMHVANLNFNAFSSGEFIQLAKTLSKFSNITVSLNEYNAEGNQASNIISHSMITNVLHQIAYSKIENDKTKIRQGLINLKEILLKDNQYYNQPLFFGVKDKNGNTLRKGIFTKDEITGEVTINEDAADMIKVALFDGIRNSNNSSSALYDTMSKSDYFMSIVHSFMNPLNYYDTEKSNLSNEANYFLRTPSDAPKNFTIRLPKYKYDDLIELKNDGVHYNYNSEIFRAISQLVKGEVQAFVDNLSVIAEANQNKSALANFYHYKGELIDNNGEYTGRVFNFEKLFDLPTYSANSNIKSALSLYGEDNTSLINKKTGIYNFNNVDWLTNDGKIDEAVIDKYLNPIIAKWIDEYSGAVNYKLVEFKDVLGAEDEEVEKFDSIKNKKISGVDVLGIVLNYVVAYDTMGALFEGDPKFYKDARTLLKRAKEAQAGGKAYAGFSIEDKDGEDIKIIDELSIGERLNIDVLKELDNLERDIDGKKIKFKLQQRNGWYAITINNIKRGSDIDTINRLKIELDEYFKDKNLDKSLKDKLINKLISKYKSDSKVDDAQSFITFEEFIRRRYADGTIRQYVPLIKEILEMKEGQTDISLEGFNARIMVQKNFYFDLYPDSKLRKRRPRQIKNAEFVLVPQLLGNNQKLKELYNMMIKNGIDQVNTLETSKASSMHVLNFFNKDGSVNKNFQQEYDSSNAKEPYYYRYLYKQQDIPKHLIDENNKVGIQIIKKILDNYSTLSDKSKIHANNFLNAFSANIKDDFNSFLNTMGWKLNKEENEVLITADNGENIALHAEEFYKVALKEALRLGLDSNIFDYLTPDEVTKMPKMPNYLGNKASKFENIAQSLFNNHITRQKFPGYHVAQIAGSSLDVKLQYHPNKYFDGNRVYTESEYNLLSQEEKDKCTNARVIEAALPIWKSLNKLKAAGIDTTTKEFKDEFLKQLHEAGCDLHIIYRIPTEGKQSVGVAQITELLSQAFDSTMALADEWVAQTGSDMDGDSIYSMTPEFDVNVDMLLQDTVFQTRFRYNRYIFNRNNNAIPGSKIQYLKENFKGKELNKEIDKLVKEYKSKSNSKYNNTLSLDEFSELSIKEQVDISIKESIEKNKKEGKYKEFTIKKVEYDISKDENSVQNRYIKHVLSKLSSEDKKSLPSIKEDYNAYVSKLIKLANSNNIISLNDFKQLPVEEQLNRRQRNNFIFDSMLNIMQDITSLEENISASNFDELTNAKNYYDTLRGESAALRSEYNILDQIDFMENAMSGARIKAFSVTRDTFLSICNKLHPTLSNRDRVYVCDGPSSYSVTKFGWSDTNRNKKGSLITNTSAQTTAHILDAIKEGTLYNENEYTFGVFKTLLDLGIDEYTAISYLYHPGITRINKHYYGINSIYNESSGDPIYNAKKEVVTKILKLLDITKIGDKEINKYTSFSEIFNLFSSNEYIRNYLFNRAANAINKDFNIDATVYYINRNINDKVIGNTLDTNSDIDYLLEEFITIDQFESLKKLSNRIESLARNSNPDKFGAKQTIRDTRETLNKINEFSNESSVTGNVLTVTITREEYEKLFGKIEKEKEDDVFNENIAEDIDYIEEDIKDNKDNEVKNKKIRVPLLKYLYATNDYKYLKQFKENSTEPSVSINSQLFDLENDKYNFILNDVESSLLKKLNDEQYKEYKKYLMSFIYDKSPILTTALKLDNKNFIEYNNDVTKEEELFRIHGYQETEDGYFKVKDLNNISEEEILKFSKLTPVQKVTWIKNNFYDNAGLIEKITAVPFKFNEYKEKGYSEGKLYFNDNNMDTDDAIKQFDELFKSNHPFIRMTMIDLIKYAFIVEGFNFKSNSITKIIGNNSLFELFIGNKKGNSTDVIEQITRLANECFIDKEDIQTFKDNFIRSHSNYAREVVFNTNSDKDTGYNTFNTSLSFNELRIIPIDESSEAFVKSLTVNKEIPNYIRISVKALSTYNTTLYRVIDSGNTLMLYPLNLLEENEVSEFSSNNANNLHKDSKYYEHYVKNLVSGNYIFENNKLYISNEISDEQKANITSERETLYKNATPEVKTFNRIEKSLKDENSLNDFAKGKSNDRFANEFKSFINKSLDSLKHSQNKSYIYFPLGSVSKIIPDNIPIYQKVEDENGNSKYISIRKFKGGRSYRNFEAGESKNIPIVLFTAYKEALSSKSPYPMFYEITAYGKKEFEDIIKSITATPKDNSSDMFSSTGNISSDDFNSITSSFEGSRDDISDITRAAAAMIDSIKYNHDEYFNIFNETFLNKINHSPIDVRSNQSIQYNLDSVYSNLSIYYKAVSNKLLTDINKFKTEDGQEFAINDSRLYEYLVENDKDYSRLLKLLLDAVTFGDILGRDNLSLNVDSEDESIKNNYNSIIKSIKAVKNNPKVKQGINKLFNIFYANKFSTNPIVKDGLIALTEAFGDSNYFDKLFSDVTELNNKQVQVITKHVNAIMSEANQILLPKAINDFNKKFDEYVKQGANIKNIIDDNGKFILAHNDNFIEDLKNLEYNAQDALIKYGKNSIEHLKAELELDEFKAKYTHQKLQANFYLKKAIYTRFVIENAPNIFPKYKALTDELNDSSLFEEDIIKEIERKKKIFNKINELLNYDEDITPKEMIDEINAVVDYKLTMQELTDEYYDKKEDEAFKSNYEYYKSILRNYEKAHQYETLEMRLQNEEYKRAFTWIKNNAIEFIDADARRKINAAFAELRSSNPSQNIILNTLLATKDHKDVLGTVDGRTFTDEERKLVKNSIVERYNKNFYKGLDGAKEEIVDKSLIKEVNDTNEEYNQHWYNMFRVGITDSQALEDKIDTINKINRILEKYLDSNGELHTDILFGKTEEEYQNNKEDIEALAKYYAILNWIRTKKLTPAQVKNIADNVETKYNMDAYNREYNKMKQLDSYKQNLWHRIFNSYEYGKNDQYVPKTNAAGDWVPNVHLYGYSVPKEDKRDKFVSAEKTAAKKLIREDITFDTTEYYDAEGRENHYSHEWFIKNHYYNPYTRKWQPLPIWTEMNVNPNGQFKDSNVVNAKNSSRNIKPKDDKLNNDYNKYHNNYNENAYNIINDRYVTGNETYSNNKYKSLNSNDKNLLKYLIDTMNGYNTGYKSKKFFNEGYAPIRFRQNIDYEFYTKELFSALGYTTVRHYDDDFNKNFSYAFDSEPAFGMADLLKAKGYKELQDEPEREINESADDYLKRIKEVRENNKKIKEDNLKLHRSILDDDWKSIFGDYIQRAINYESKNKIKNEVYILLESLKLNDAIDKDKNGNVIRSRNSRKDDIQYEKTPQENTYFLVQNWGRRLILNQYKEDSNLRGFADFMQSVTSAKYMILNVTGGISNVTTGEVNIAGETFAGIYYSKKSLQLARRNYAKALPDFINSGVFNREYDTKITNKTVALCKWLDVIDYDAMLERRPNESATNYAERIRTFLYSPQSMGEHYMQNTVLLAMSYDNKVYKDVNDNYVIGSFADYTKNLETQALLKTINNLPDYAEINVIYNKFLNNIKKDGNLRRRIDSNKQDFNSTFIKFLQNDTNGRLNIVQDYIKNKQDALKDAKEKFDSFSSVYDSVEIIDGIIQAKESSGLTSYQLGEFRDKVISVNKKIHGVYDKLGAAAIERKWYGSLVMQYHKHLYPGIMKRYRGLFGTKGYYNETRQSQEFGSYASLIKFLTTEFNSDIFKGKDEDSRATVLEVLHNTINALIRTFTYYKINKALLSDWELRNIRRTFGDLCGMIAALGTAIALYSLLDDDKVQDNWALATLVYLSDRLFTESNMYQPFGMYSEFKTLYSSPIAMSNSFEDAMQIIGISWKWLTDEDYSITYPSGIYKGDNKIWVRIRRNIPAYRVYDRLSHMKASNKYYRIGTTGVNKRARHIAELINPDKKENIKK